MRNFAIRSIPFSTPSATTPQVRVRKQKCQKTFFTGSDTRTAKPSFSVSASLESTLFVSDPMRYDTHQPPTTE